MWYLFKLDYFIHFTIRSSILIKVKRGILELIHSYIYIHDINQYCLFSVLVLSVYKNNLHIKYSKNEELS
jgi:hypothetical protein